LQLNFIYFKGLCLFILKMSVNYKLLDGQDEEEPGRTRRASSVYSQYTDPGIAEEPVHLHEASSLSCYTNLTNTIIGAGVLSLPYAVAYSGSVLGIVLVIISGIAQIFSLHVLSICAAKVPAPSSFYSVTQASVPSLTFLIDLAVAIQSFGVCSSYLIVMGDLMPDVMEDFGIGGVWQRRHIWTFIGFCIVAPLSTLKKLDALKYTSGLCVLFVAFLTCMVLFFAIPGDGLHPCDFEDDDRECRGDRPLLSVDNNTFRVFSIFTNAFSCQSVSPSLPQPHHTTPYHSCPT
jgi:amino acid permease